MIASFLWVLAAGVHAAGRCYTAQPVILKSKPQPIAPVCRALEANLNELCEQPPPMCALKIAPKYANDLSIPDWKPVDLHGNLDIVEATVRARWNIVPDKQAGQRIWDDERPAYEKALAAGTLTVKSAELDLFRIGKKSTAYRIDPGSCEADNRDVLQSMDKEVWNSGFITRTTLVLPSPPAVADIAQAYFIGDVGEGDVLTYKGLPFRYVMATLQKRNSSQDPTIALIVWQPTTLSQEGSKPSLFQQSVCHIEYQASGDKK
jgi:hypothetical protein